MTGDPFARVRRLALALPGVEEGTLYGGLAWRVARTAFAWERPLRVADRAALGGAAPEGPVLGVRVADLGVKDALLAGEPALLTTPHFDGHASVLVDLARAADPLLVELLEEAWRSAAPRRLVAERDQQDERD